MIYDIVDLIKIPGVTGVMPALMDASLFESLKAEGLAFSSQGDAMPINVSVTLGSSTPLSISWPDIPDVSAASLLAQNDMILKQSAYLTSLGATLISKNNRLPQQSGIVDFILEEFGEHVLESLTGGDDTTSWSPVIGQIRDFVVSTAGEAIEFLKSSYLDGNNICQAMVAENTAMLSWPASGSLTTDDFDRRNSLITQHNEHIRMLVMQSSISETDVSKLGEEIQGTWRDWMGNLDTIFEDMQEWIDTTSEEFGIDLTASTGEDETDTQPFALPVPIDPGLPTKPPSTHPLVIFIYYLLKYGKLILKVWEIIKKVREKKGETDMSKIVEALQDLQFNEVEFKIPNSNMKVNFFGKTIRYGGDTT